MKTNSTALVVPAPGTNNPAAAPLRLRDIRDPVDVPNPWAWVVLGLVVAVAAAAAWLAWKRWKRLKSQPPPAPPPIPPHVRALEMLRAALRLISEPQPYCTAVSNAVRVYLEERFSLHAPDRTTEEFLDELQSSAALALEHKQTLGAFLSRCDLVKFARYEPTENELRSLFDAAVRLVEETKPVAVIPEPSATNAESGTETASGPGKT